MSTMMERPAGSETIDATVRALGAGLAARTVAHDAEDRFVAESMAEVKAQGLLGIGVPVELGGGGASHAELAAMLRTMAHHCGSTALTLSMHTHLVAMNVWRWRHDKAPVDALLGRVAKEGLFLVSTGGGDWLPSGGVAEPVEGGYRVTARKPFASGSPAGSILMTSAVTDDPEHGPTVLHFGVPMSAEGLRREATWRTLGMRGTGSDDVLLEGVFVPAAAVGVRRPKDKWHRLFHVITMVALPLIYAVYVGVAEAARDRALALAGKRRQDPHVAYTVGEMETELHAARLALGDMLSLAADGEPGDATTSRIAMGRSLAARHALRAVELAMEAAGGAGFYRDAGLERLFRDIQGTRFHPLQAKPQAWLTGRHALGLPIDAG